nr:protein 5nuc [Quercus suber]
MPNDTIATAGCIFHSALQEFAGAIANLLPVSQIFSSNSSHSAPPDLRLIHYNDVYHVEPSSRDPVGGIARFKTICDFYAHDERYAGQVNALTFFSGDAFNPSLESSVTKALNSLRTTAACLGNHDLDFGVQQFQLLAGMCDFPWLCANVLDPALGSDVPLGNCKRSVMITASNGIRIGVIGLVEQEWLDTINTLPPDLRFVEPAIVCTMLSPAPAIRSAALHVSKPSVTSMPMMNATQAR